MTDKVYEIGHGWASGDYGICVFSDTGLGHVFSVTKKDDKTVMIKEECDGWEHKVLTKNEAIKLFKDIAEWLEE